MAMWFGKYGNERILVPHQAQLNLTTAITLCTWMNIKAIPVTAGTYATLISKNDFYQLHYSANAVSTSFAFQYAGPAWRTLNDSIVPTIDVWYHFAATYDNAAAGNNMILYRNGVSVNSARYTDAIATTGTGLSIASLNSSRYLAGILADVRIYNRALSVNEIESVYGSLGHDGIHYGLVARYLLDEGYDGQVAGPVSSTVYDTSDYQNNGTTYND
jgi:hypothetical protein